MAVAVIVTAAAYYVFWKASEETDALQENTEHDVQISRTMSILTVGSVVTLIIGTIILSVAGAVNAANTGEKTHGGPSVEEPKEKTTEDLVTDVKARWNKLMIKAPGKACNVVLPTDNSQNYKIFVRDVTGNPERVICIYCEKGASVESVMNAVSQEIEGMFKLTICHNTGKYYGTCIPMEGDSLSDRQKEIYTKEMDVFLKSIPSKRINHCDNEVIKKTEQIFANMLAATGTCYLNKPDASAVDPASLIEVKYLREEDPSTFVWCPSSKTDAAFTKFINGYLQIEKNKGRMNRESNIVCDRTRNAYVCELLGPFPLGACTVCEFELKDRTQ